MKKKVLIGLAIAMALLLSCLFGIWVGQGTPPAPTATPTKTATLVVDVIPTHWPTSTLVATPNSGMTPGATPRPKKVWPTPVTTPGVTLDGCIGYMVLEVYLVELADEIVVTINTCVRDGLGSKSQCEDIVLDMLWETAEQECIELGYR